MVVHADEARNDGISSLVEHCGASRNLGRGGRTDLLNLAICDDDGLIIRGSGAGSIDDTNVRDCNGRRIDEDKSLNVVRKMSLGESRDADEEKEKGKCSAHGTTSYGKWEEDARRQTSDVSDVKG
jgi:hypothetical protein